MKIEVEELHSYSLSDVSDMDGLMKELSPTSFCNEAILDAIITDVNSHAYIIRRDNHIIGAGCLCVMHTLEFTIANVESVVVASCYRGKGYGKELVDYIIGEARRICVHSVHLTSNPKRIAANNLYKKMGFVKYDTNCYFLEID